MKRVPFLALFAAACDQPLGPLQVEFEPMIDVSVCRSADVQWCCQTLSADADGHFDESWAPSQPETAQIVGDISDDAFTATLSCLPSGSPSGTLEGTRVGDAYEGTWSFDGQSGTFTVRPQSE